MTETIERKEILPVEGLWDMESFADYLQISTTQLAEAFEKYGIKTFHVTSRPRHKLFSISDLVIAIGKGKHAVKEDLK